MLLYYVTHTQTGWDVWGEFCYSPCLFWRCFSAGESGMLVVEVVVVVPVWKTTAIKRAFCAGENAAHSILPTAAASSRPQGIRVWLLHNSAGTEAGAGLSWMTPGMGSNLKCNIQEEGRSHLRLSGYKQGLTCFYYVNIKCSFELFIASKQVQVWVKNNISFNTISHLLLLKPLKKMLFCLLVE